MFKQLKMKIASRALQRKSAKKNTKKSKNQNNTALNRIIAILKAPFIWIANVIKRIWGWIRSIDLIGLVNTTLLVAIITLFTMLIIDIINCNKPDVVMVANNANVTTEKVDTIVAKNVVIRPVKETAKKAPAKILKKTVALPIKIDKNTNKPESQPVQFVKVKECETTKAQTAKQNETLYGDIIIDSFATASVLKTENTIKGNLYLQNMRKYTLPCDVKIEGDVYLRDLNMLQFCGDFTITGNIYVSPRSSFGPLPKTAKLGGQIIL